MSRVSVNDIRAWKNNDEPLVCLTAYTAPMASILDQHCDLLLIGDSMGMALYGMDNTLGVTMDMIINHTQAVIRGSETAFILADMPYGSFEDSPEQALKNAQRIIEETGCGGVKVEVDSSMVETVKILADHDIPVIAHIGLRPQMVVKEGGYKVKGKTEDEARSLVEDAVSFEKAGAFAILVEGTVASVSTEITKAVGIPTIGIGASPECDGQILVTEDMLGALEMKAPKFAKQYGDLRGTISEMVKDYAGEVRTRNFPAEEHLYYPKTKFKIAS